MRRAIFFSMALISLSPATHASANAPGRLAKAGVVQRVKDAWSTLTIRRVTLRGGDNTIDAFHRATASGKPTIIRMDGGSLHVRPGQAPRFEITTGQYPESGHSIRRAHNLAYSIGPVTVTRASRELGQATKDLASERPLLDQLSRRGR